MSGTAKYCSCAMHTTVSIWHWRRAETLDAFPPWFHFGFRLDRPDEVRALYERMTRDGVESTALEQFPDFVVFRCRDPDGYQLEVYWE